MSLRRPVPGVVSMATSHYQFESLLIDSLSQSVPHQLVLLTVSDDHIVDSTHSSAHVHMLSYMPGCFHSVQQVTGVRISQVLYRSFPHCYFNVHKPQGNSEYQSPAVLHMLAGHRRLHDSPWCGIGSLPLYSRVHSIVVGCALCLHAVCVCVCLCMCSEGSSGHWYGYGMLVLLVFELNWFSRV
jgi:hypothetical protein